VYLQTNKGIYETGEDLWFKGYALNSQYLIPSKISTTLYVQLIEDTTNTAVWEEKYKIKNGFVDGHVYIKDAMLEGNYTLVAFTPYSFYGTKEPIKSVRKLKIIKNIINYQDKRRDTLTIQSNKRSLLNFTTYPEGGYLVSGITNKIGFKAIDTLGAPKAVSGVLYENNEPIVTFKSTHEGMGSFIFTPDILKSYHIELDSIKTKKRYALSSIKSKGYVLQLLNNTEEEVIFKVTQNAIQHKETVYLRVQVRGVVYSIAKAVLGEEIIIKIPLKELPQGIAEVTLFNSSLQPLAERLVYVNQDQKLHIKAVLDDVEYFTKEKATLKLLVKDQNGEPVIAHLGVSIYDQIYDNQEDEKTIETHYHLSELLKGKLHNPSYYFNKKNKDRKEALDQLLLTQGWRAYLWSEGNLKHLSLKKLILNDTITGRVSARKQKNNTILSEQYVMAFTAEKQSGKSFITVDSTRKFTVLPKDMQQAKGGSLYFKLLMKDPKSKISIKIKDPAFSILNNFRKNDYLKYPTGKEK